MKVSAFPGGYVKYSRPVHDPGGDLRVTEYTVPKYVGMDLRDYFAAKAMQGFAGRPSVGGSIDAIAVLSYKWADAMIKARES